MQVESFTPLSLSPRSLLMYLLRKETILASVTILDAINLRIPTSALTITVQDRI